MKHVPRHIDDPVLPPRVATSAGKKDDDKMPFFIFFQTIQPAFVFLCVLFRC